MLQVVSRKTSRYNSSYVWCQYGFHAGFGGKPVPNAVYKAQPQNIKLSLRTSEKSISRPNRALAVSVNATATLDRPPTEAPLPELPSMDKKIKVGINGEFVQYQLCSFPTRSSHCNKTFLVSFLRQILPETKYFVLGWISEDKDVWMLVRQKVFLVEASHVNIL